MKIKTNLLLASLLATFIFVSCGSDKKPAESTTQDEEMIDEEEEIAEEMEEEAETEVITQEGIAAGKSIFEAKACMACHQEATKTVGPALKTIATAYDGNRAGLRSFLKEEADAIVDPAMAAVMQPQIKITKEMSDSDLNKVMDYILSQK